MPIPQQGESESEYIARCMEDPAMIQDYPNEDQRYIVCVAIYQEEKPSDT